MRLIQYMALVFMVLSKLSYTPGMSTLLTSRAVTTRQTCGLLGGGIQLTREQEVEQISTTWKIYHFSSGVDWGAEF